MRLLVATRRRNGSEAHDYDTGILEGELVEPMPGGWMSDELEDDCCECEYTFLGVSSGNATTTAVIAERPEIDRDTLTAILADKHPDEDADTIAGYVEDQIDWGQAFEVGTVVGIRRYELRPHL